jgi:hypothetical protein
MIKPSNSIKKQEFSLRLDYLLVLLSLLLAGNLAAASALTITTPSPLPSGTVDNLYSTTFAASGGTAPYAWTITSSSVPGLALSSSGVLSGVPTAASSYSITVRAIDSTSPTHQTASATFNVTTNVSANTNYYVSPGGSDATGAGTLASPWATITHAVNTVGGPGVTINARAGTYNERVSITRSGSASGGYFIIRNYDYPTAAIINGGSVSIVNNGEYAYGLVDIDTQSYVTVDGFEIYNFTTTNDNLVPAGVHVEGSGTNVQLVNNYIHHIWNTGTASVHNGNCTGAEPEAFGLIVAGTNGTAPLNNITIAGNELSDLQTGCSESFTVNGDVNGFTISHNKVHNNSNIGIAALGGEGVASGFSQYNGSANDQARNGEISDNTVYTIHSNSQGSSGVYGLNCYCDDGIYLDGSAEITVERNTVYDVDLGIEVTGEGAKQNTTNNVVRDNLFFYNSYVGISIGGQGTPGGSSNTTVVNNTTWSNGVAAASGPLGELATGTKLTGTNIVDNNIFYASSVSGTLLHAKTTATVALNHNLYFAPGSSENWVWGTKKKTTFSTYQSTSGQDANSQYADPDFDDISATPPTTLPNLNVQSGSAALGKGTILSPISTVGPSDVGGVTPRILVTNDTIDVGAYEQ